MNAVFQQLYMQPGLAEAFLSIEDDTEQPDESVFCQVQSLFGHLMESKLQYYVPENFWKASKHAHALHTHTNFNTQHIPN